MTASRQADVLAIGDRVRLEPDLNWLSEFQPLAESGRIGTITARPSDRCWTVQFDVMRPGSRPKVGDFFAGNLILVAKGPYQPPTQERLI